MNDLEPDNIPLNFLWHIGEGREKITTKNVFVLVRKRETNG
jgi:hypothetical protein